MQVFSDYTNVATSSGTAVAIGNFDGVHLGHQALLRSAVSRAADMGIAPCVLTFDPHPVRLFAPHVKLHSLTSLEERVSLLDHYGVQVVLAQTFDRAFAALTEYQFIKRVLVDSLKAKVVIVGYDFRFGAGRSGDLSSLRRYGAQLGFEVVVIDAVETADSRPISSTRVRSSLQTGDLDTVRRILGRPMHLRGLVVPGEQRGRALGFRTANIQADVGVLLEPGVYAGWMDYGDGPRHAVANIGRNPTFGDDRPMTVEVHILNHDAPDLYGKSVRFWIADSIRPERKFESIEGLVTQIQTDCRSASDVLAGLDDPPALIWE